MFLREREMVRMELLAGMIHIVVVMLLFLKATTKEVHYEGRIAKDGCEDRCGSVYIPYPFGIGPNCYANQTYEITCSNSKPFLTAINNLEVLYIDFGKKSYPQAVIRVRNPINHTYMNLSGTPFFFASSSFYFSSSSSYYFTSTSYYFTSSYGNIFVGLGCNIEAQLLSHTPTKIVAQCTTICNNGSSRSSSNYAIMERDGMCYGINCCTAAVPDLAKAVNTSLSTVGSSSSGKKYGFLVATDWFFQKTGLTYLEKSRQSVPVNLIWKTDETCYHATSDNILDYGYGDETTTNCYCGEYPSSGSPYLQNGCPTDGRQCNGQLEELHRDGSACIGINPNSRSRTIKFVFVGLGSGAGGLLMIMGAWWLRKIFKKRNKAKLKKKFFERNGGLLLQQQLSTAEEGYAEKSKVFSSKELETATDHYNENRVLGRGGQGTVYKGMLIDGKIVAVKKSKIVDEGKLNEFINEVVILSQINHRNVVKLHGCCLETEVPLLVYDFIPNGTLFQYIHDHENEDFPLTWDVRLRIASEVAGALSYLHSAASVPIYHRDIKSSNILLDDKYRAKVADFGTSRSAEVDQTHMTTRVQGTFGYLDPEYYQSSQFTAKSDVYSFGVVLVELLTGQKAILPITFMEGRSLATYFLLSMKENCLFDIIDAQVLKEGKEREILGVAYLANRCLNLNGRKRPTMKEVSTELEAIKTTNGASAHFQVELNEEAYDHGIAQLVGPFDCTASTSITSLLGR